jgi:hypothetical protein
MIEKRTRPILCLFLVVASVAFAAIEGSLEVIGESDLTEAGGSARDNHRMRFQQSFTEGSATTSAQIEIMYRTSGSIASGASTSIDLAGSLVDPLGDTVVFTRIRGLIFQNTGTTTITIGNAPANGWYAWSSVASSTLSVPASSSIMLASPFGAWQVTAGTGDLLQLTNASGGTGTYKLWIIGND